MVFVRIVFFNLLHINIWGCYCLMFLFGLFIPILIAKLILVFPYKNNSFIGLCRIRADCHN